MQAIALHGVRFRERLYTPLVTLWTFLYQSLSEGQSCRGAVAKLVVAVAGRVRDRRLPTPFAFPPLRISHFPGVG